jgi:hypothetical protein
MVSATQSRLSPRGYLPGGLALGCYLAHAVDCVLRGHVEDLLWTCNVASAVIALGLLARRPAITAPGTVVLAAGMPLWVADLAAGGEFIPTSIFTHVGSLAVGIWSARADGIPRHTWWRALVGMAALQVVTRAVTPPAANVNMAFSVYAPARALTTSYPLYWTVSAVLFAGAFAALSHFGRLLARAPRSPSPTEARGA